LSAVTKVESGNLQAGNIRVILQIFEKGIY